MVEQVLGEFLSSLMVCHFVFCLQFATTLLSLSLSQVDLDQGNGSVTKGNGNDIL